MTFCVPPRHLGEGAPDDDAAGAGESSPDENTAREERYVAQYVYKPKFQDELALQPGLPVTVTKQPDGGWWYGTADEKFVDSRSLSELPFWSFCTSRCAYYGVTSHFLGRDGFPATM